MRSSIVRRNKTMPQTTSFACPKCQKKLAVPNQHVGKKIRCPGCTTVFRAGSKPVEPRLVTATVVSDDDPFGDGGFGGDEQTDPFVQNDPFSQTDPFSDLGFQQPVGQTPGQPAYLSAGSKPSSRGGARAKHSSRKNKSSTPEMTEAEQRAFGSGIFLLVIPIVATVLPLMGLQLRRLAKLGDAAPLAGIVLGLVGAGFIAYGRRNQKDKILSPILAAGFSVVMGIGGFLLLISLSSESDLAQPDLNQSQPSGLSAPGNPDGTDNFAPQQAFQDGLANHKKIVEENRRKMEEQMKRTREEAMERMRKAREGMQQGFPPGGGFPTGAGDFQPGGIGFEPPPSS